MRRCPCPCIDRYAFQSDKKGLVVGNRLKFLQIFALLLAACAGHTPELAEDAGQNEPAEQVEEKEKTRKQRIDYAWGEVKSIVGKIWPFIIAGVAIGGIFHGYPPEGILAQYAGKGNPFAVPIAILIGVPLYSNVMGMIPIVESLVGKGLPLGTALAFLMSVTALSLPEMLILQKVLKPKLIGTFIGIVALAIMMTGYLMNIIL